MTHHRLTPYEGKEPYIFISYSHKDADRVLPILQRLDAEGYRFWFDEGIDPGSEWPESIARHLGGSRVCMAFISENSIASNNCRREINYALSKNLGFLSVALEACEMSPGLELQIASYQALLLYKYPAMELFYDRLLDLEILSPCRRPLPRTEAARTPVAAPEAVPEEPPTPRETEPAAPPSGAGSEKAPGAAEGPASPPTGSAAKKEPAPEKPETAAAAQTGTPEPKKKPARGKLLAALALAALALIAAGIVVLNGKTASVSINGRTYTTQSVTDAAITARDMRKLMRLQTNNSMYFKRCSFERGALNAIKKSPAASLTLIDCTGVDSLDFLQRFPSLRSLQISGCGVTNAMFPATLPTKDLQTLILNNNQLTALPAAAVSEKLKTLDVSGNTISDLSPIRGDTALTSLNVSDTRVADLGPAAGLEKLRELYARNSQISDISPLTGLIYMEKLDLSHNRITSWAPLENMTRLKQLRAGGNTDSEGIGSAVRSEGTLKELDVSGIAADGELLTLLRECRSLERLDANGCGLDDESAAFLSGMTGLKTLNLAGNALTSCRALTDLSSLEYLNLSGNRIASLDGFPTLGADARINLLLHDNEITSLSGLPEKGKYRLLTLCGNPLWDFSPLADDEGYAIVFDFPENADPAPIRSAGFTRYFAAEVPLSRRVDLETAIHVKYLNREDPEELLAVVSENDYYSRVTFS